MMGVKAGNRSVAGDCPVSSLYHMTVPLTCGTVQKVYRNDLEIANSEEIAVGNVDS